MALPEIQSLLEQAEIEIMGCHNEQACHGLIKSYKDRMDLIRGDRQLINEIGRRRLEAFARKATNDNTYVAPTPPVSYQVQWFEKNHPEVPVSATVTAQCGAGIVNLRVVPDGDPPFVRHDVYHAGHPVHKIPNSPQTNNSGSWNYADEEIPNSHFTYALRQSEELREKVRRQEVNNLKKSQVDQARQKLRETEAADPANVIAGDEYRDPQSSVSADATIAKGTNQVEKPPENSPT